jgi:hypothetical protein
VRRGSDTSIEISAFGSRLVLGSVRPDAVADEIAAAVQARIADISQRRPTAPASSDWHGDSAIEFVPG